MIEQLNLAMDAEPYSMAQADRETNLLAGVNELIDYHYSECAAYRRIIDGAWGRRTRFDRIDEIPYLPVSLFKTQKLQSIEDDQIRVTLTSSGTTGQAVSRIVLDKEASSLQQRALANSLMHILGRHRLPMLVIDTESVFKDPKMMSARGAGVLGIMRYGRDYAFALDPNLAPNFDTVREFLDKHKGAPFFMFGFTFMVWINFYEKFRSEGLDLSNGILIHSGGWKKMIEASVDNNSFRDALNRTFGLKKIYNFYGMVEQIGTIFLEGPSGLLFPPNFADIIIRDPVTWQPSPIGEPGVVQILSLLPRSYPGNSLLTEDIGVIEQIDPNSDGFMGKGIKILGRIAKSELRGCSDVIGATV